MTEEKKIEERIVASTGTGRFMGDIATIRLIKRKAETGEVLSDTTHTLDPPQESKDDGIDR